LRFQDQLEDIGAWMVLYAVRRTVDNAGDGTTTTTIMANAILKYYNELDGNQPTIRELRDVIQEWVDQFQAYVEANKIPYEDQLEMIEHVSLISSNGDKHISKLVREVYADLGVHADVIVDTSPNLDTHHTTHKGMYFEGGYKANEFITDKERAICEMEKVAIVITDKKVTSASEFNLLFQKLLGSKFSVLLIAPQVDGEAMYVLKRTAINHPGKLCVIKSPGINVRRSEMMEDIAIFTGGQVIVESRDGTIDEACEGNKYNGIIGMCDKVVIRRDSTTILGGKNTKDRLDERVKYLEMMRDDQKDPLMKKRYEKRISGLTSGVGVIYVGGPSEVEVKEKRDRLDDCICAVKSSLEMGVCLGGGLLPYNFAIQQDQNSNTALMLDAALREPIFTIWKKNGDREVPENYVNYLKENNVIDPAKVLIECFRNATSVAYSIISSNAVVINDEASNEILGDLPSFEDATQ
jgi:chaperonin GroEL